MFASATLPETLSYPMNHRLPFLAACLTALFAAVIPSPASAKAGPARSGAVQAELVAAESSIQPGQKFWVALQLDHDEHWHSYWINPGTGYPTSINWTLPPGFKAGPVHWTTPHVVKDTAGNIAGNGYEGRVLHLVEITPPADLPAGSPVVLKAAVEWLMCKESCMPGEAALELTLPVRAEPPTADASHGPAIAAARASLPPPPGAAWRISASRGAKSVELRLSAGPGNTHRPSGLHFFSEDALTDYAATQTVREADGGWILDLPLSEGAPATAAALKGVLAAASGFAPGSGYAGLAVDVAFSRPGINQPAPAAAHSGAKPAAGASGGLAGTLLLAFLGGIVLNLMPCVFPVLGIKILGFVNQSGNDRTKVTMHGLAFAAGVLLSFWVLAGLLLAFRAGGAQLGWGFQLQSPAFVFGMAVFLLVFALNMSGLFEVGLAATGVGAGLQHKEGYAGSFFTGMLATLVATPCSAPFLAPALGAALSLSAVQSFAVFTTIALGLSLPYLLLSAFPQAIRLLPRPGPWMETFKQFMAFPLYATVGWLLWVLAAQTSGDDYALLNIILGMVLVAMATWIYGRWGQSFGKPTRQRFGRIGTVVVAAAGLWLGWPSQAPAPAAGEAAGYQVAWEKWSPAAIESALAAGRPVYVDFTARWCATCQTNKAAVFHSDAVLAEFARQRVVLLRGDWTNKDPQITQELARWNRSAVPFNLIYAPGRKDPVVLPELLTPTTVLDALAAATRPGK